MSQIIGKQPKDLDVRYFGLNHFGWWTSVKDKEGHEYLPEIRDYVAKHGYLTQVEVDTQHMAGNAQKSERSFGGRSEIFTEYVLEILLLPGLCGGTF